MTAPSIRSEPARAESTQSKPVVNASAPGKLVLAGEYAVLEGAPALVMAIDRRARVVLRDAPDADVHIDAPDLGIVDARCGIGGSGRVQWREAQHAGHLGLVTAALEACTTPGAPAAFHATLDTRGFFAAAPARPKLGLGSSAALLVALAGAIQARAGRAAPQAAPLIAAHRGLQHGRGSGLDVATSLSGGLVAYRLHDGAPQIRAARWPAGLHYGCAWTGRAASTAGFLERLAAWRAQAPAAYAARLDEVGACSRAATEAVDAGDVPGLLEAIGGCAAALARLGAASGLDIVSDEHRRIGAMAAASGVVYKSCGAGGGDIGIALSADPGRLDHWRGGLAAAGFDALDLVLEARGLLIGA